MNGTYEHSFALMDTGASRSCISYRDVPEGLKIQSGHLNPYLRVCTADGSDLGSLGRIRPGQLKLGDKEVIQDFRGMQTAKDEM